MIECEKADTKEKEDDLLGGHCHGLVPEFKYSSRLWRDILLRVLVKENSISADSYDTGKL